MKCPICGGDRDMKMPIELKNLISENKLISEHVNPGGRELVFKTKGRIQVSDMCNACDYEAIQKFLTTG